MKKNIISSEQIMSEESDSPTLHSGWIYKRGETVKSWKKRFLKVTATEITYGKDEKHILKAIQRINIKSVEPFAHTDAPKDYREFGFKVITEKRALKVAVQTKREQDIFIYHISPRKIFGTELEYLMNLESHQNAVSPVIIEQCVDLLTRNGNLSAKGLFRVSGGEDEMKRVTHIYDTEYVSSNENGVWSRNPLESGVSIHTVAGLLKKYMRELPVSLIPSEYASEIISLIRTNTPNEKLIEFYKELFSKISRNYYVTLNTICFLLYETHLHNELMKATNLGLVMGQNFIKQETTDIADVMIMAKFVEFIIEHYEEIFDKDADYLLKYKKNIEEYSQIAKERKEKIRQELMSLREEANDIDQAMSTLSSFINVIPGFSDDLYARIYHAIYHVKTQDDLDAPLKSYKSLFLEDQLKKHNIHHSELLRDDEQEEYLE